VPQFKPDAARISFAMAQLLIGMWLKSASAPTCRATSRRMPALVGSNLRDGVCTTSRDIGRLQVTDKITDMPRFRVWKNKKALQRTL
jgi:hypothetical protein